MLLKPLFVLSVTSLFSLSLFCHNAMAASELPTANAGKQFISVQDQQQPVWVKPWQGPHQRGAAIIVGPTDSPASGSGLIRYLRDEIPAFGWASLSIKPTEGLYRPNFATDAEEIPKAGEAQLTLSRHQQAPKFSSNQLLELRNFQQELMVDSLDQLQVIEAQFPGKRLLIVTDDSAGMVINLLFEAKLAKPDLLVVINPYREYEQIIAPQHRGLSIAQQLREIDIPILDLQSADAHQISMTESASRKALNKAKSSQYYRQYQLALNLDNQSGWEQVLHHIAGFSKVITAR
ncbi:DUF3530 family protein [Shewanella sp. 4_MG-2023]|uniref:DUF3530 family protein n=1 Tax=Shewanella sp. 4_MG-2023 TaxID=3062652 RepID=UPI0026E394B9|nr:DUF3530 family protein [Shewanella sp. 4_MG-2023]MDO6679531.1 DUF3530 family protein [Shewanella sp. 4_MG-2023]